MGPKKKVQDDDESTEKLMRIYRSKCQKYAVPVSRLFKEKVQQALQDDPPHLRKLLFWEQIGATGIRAMFQAFCQQDGYKHLQTIVMTNIKTYDQGCIYIAQYLQKAKSVKQLELQINNIGPQGCKHIGQALMPANSVPLITLNLSYNKFKTEGLEQLAKGLAINGTIQKLYLDFCQIDPQGSKYIQQILSFHQSKLQILSLNGNMLKNEGVYQVFRALEANQSLSQLYLMNNQFGQSTEISTVDKICKVLKQKNMTLIYCNLDGNGLYNQSGKKFIDVMKNGNPLLLIEFGINCEKDVMDDFKKLAKKRKKKKKKKKGKKGKKKK